jgi:hypothetical protein
MEFEMSYGYLESASYLEICQWYGEICFAVVAITLNVGREFPGGTDLSHYRYIESFMEGQCKVCQLLRLEPVI